MKNTKKVKENKSIISKISKIKKIANNYNKYVKANSEKRKTNLEEDIELLKLKLEKEKLEQQIYELQKSRHSIL